MLKIEVQLWCDVCGAYPPKIVSEPTFIRTTWLATNASGTLVLPEGWLRGGWRTEEWESEKTYCSDVCQDREVELPELAALLEGRHRWESKTSELRCDNCGDMCKRLANQNTPRYILPPGWSHATRYLLCGKCMARPEVVVEYHRRAASSPHLAW